MTQIYTAHLMPCTLTLLRASSPRICSLATHPSSSIKLIQSLRISKLQRNQLEIFEDCNGITPEIIIPFTDMQ